MACKRRPMPSRKPCWRSLWWAKTGFRAPSASFGSPCSVFLQIRRGVVMKTVSGLRVAVALLSASMGPALIGQAENPMAVVQQEPGQQERHAMEMSVAVQPDNQPGEGQ